ncbi:MAG TPA: potassium channel family protein [Methylomirabilota bacterium]|jgi:voltage-gated potassium channel Kch|nr:potassium channel family protein [Methylomirabilota bacterium]
MVHIVPHPLALVGGFALAIIILVDAFEAIILPRRVTRKIRLTRLFFRTTWAFWKAVVSKVTNRKTREALLGIFGPSSLLLLIAIWALGLVLGFGLMQYAAGSAIDVHEPGHSGFAMDVYLSATTFFTLGLGDAVPRVPLARCLLVAEAGLGYGFLAVIVGYLPFIYSSFSRREVNISLLDARAGTPPTAGELLRRYSYPQGQNALRDLLREWESWCAELMESHLSYPVLAYFRSQHDNQSWIASLTAILDACALIRTGIEGACERQAELTFAIARHAVVDLSQVFDTAPSPPATDRLTSADLHQLRDTLAAHGMKLHDGEEADRQLHKLRNMYEPFIYSLAMHLSQPLPPWIPQKKGKDNWQTTAWARESGLLDKKDVTTVVIDEHF